MSDALSIELPIRPESAGWAREAVGEFRDHLDESSFIDLQLMVSELVADAVRAEAGKEQKIAIRIEARDRHIHVELQEGALRLSASLTPSGARRARLGHVPHQRARRPVGNPLRR